MQTPKTHERFESIPSLQGFEGKVFYRDSKKNSEYALHRYQYAYSSYLDGSMEPSIIFYAQNEEDIKRVIRFARESNISVSLRTGGHQYSGISSTSGKNVQLDLSQAFCKEEDFQYDETSNRLRVGISFTLKTFNLKMREKKLFVPHGVCENVHLGGHAQTGGYGQLLRAFGLFADHIRAFEIITADAEKQFVNREKNPDLFFAVLGGSPGNFGVLTHIVLEPNRDEDHPHSRGLMGVYLYDVDRLKRLTEFAAEMANDDEMPIDFDFTVTITSLNQDFFFTYPNLDNMMREHHPDLFGGTGRELSAVSPSGILVFAQWANTQGKDQPYTPEIAAWFDKIKNAVHGIDIAKQLSFIGVDTTKRMGFKGYVDNEHHVPMSELTAHWVFLKVREYELPFIKRLYTTNEKITDEWVNQFVHHVNEVQTNLITSHCKIACQIQPNCRKNKMMENKGNGTAFNWRDTTFGCTCDIFYAPNGRDYAEKWAQRNDKDFLGEKGSYSKHDFRLFWATHGNLNLSEVWEKYYENADIYQRLLRIKNEVDPDKIFSPNAMCIGGAKTTAIVAKSSTSISSRVSSRFVSTKTGW